MEQFGNLSFFLLEICLKLDFSTIIFTNILFAERSARNLAVPEFRPVKRKFPFVRTGPESICWRVLLIAGVLVSWCAGVFCLMPWKSRCLKLL